MLAAKPTTGARKDLNAVPQYTNCTNHYTNPTVTAHEPPHATRDKLRHYSPKVKRIHRPPDTTASKPRQTTNRKVAGSSPAERAKESPGKRRKAREPRRETGAL